MSSAGSPPTRRVIAVVELLTESDRGLSASDIAASLSLARATVSAVLAELTVAGWVRRDEGLRYRPGPALARLSPAPPGASGAAVQAELAALASAAGCGATLSRIESDRLTVVAKQYADARVVPGLHIGQSLPLAYPAGAAVMPWRTDAERRAWLATASGPGRRAAPALLRFVAGNGYAVFRPDADDAGLVDVLADLLGAVGAEVLQPQLRSRVLRQLSRLTARPYTDADIVSEESLPVSYLSAPVFDGATAPYEVQIGPLRPAVGRVERAGYIEAIRVGAQAISTALGEPARGV
ncbi:helix-turn-helix domain-containing protein [Nocardia cyriacigeorgica]|uniref:Helix-turn-helix domain-containing protein n=1 Tax=Nocardia cyriacigeorgica TaxID=135487 RepID=A0A6P1D2M1_9NOCA|nr:helix-turn-helix domain-containing protein [Nocardia cyriacigeorgica]NEW39392.1 helix-turn-helix domain-containing protein [Nocardia cyriacigeorgica]NEW43681.1 helix-turn-helix domain-containing protein [Nocardia cyriacigeorgica]NEW49897.1 helix-turn-helix domain-containing protein [Nocardia cyriacigeorgica]NEW54632.1 helix-turn-helix domain-containing protein [Nocardia cyriacigeorgica]